MREAVRTEYRKLAKILDKADADCRAVDAKIKAGEEITVAEKILHNDWMKEQNGRPWRQNRKIVLKITRAAKMAAKNKRRTVGNERQR